MVKIYIVFPPKPEILHKWEVAAMLSRKDLLILCELRKNAREGLTNISKITSVPVSTIFDRLKEFQGKVILRHTTLLNYNLLGYNTRANILIKVAKESRDDARNYLMKHPNINSVFRVNNGFDFMFESLFQDMKSMEAFLEMLETKFNIEEKKVHYVIEDVKKECFLADPELITLI